MHFVGWLRLDQLLEVGDLQLIEAEEAQVGED